MVQVIIDGEVRNARFMRMTQEANPSEIYIVQFQIETLEGVPLFLYEEQGSNYLECDGNPYNCLNLPRPE